MNYIKEEVSTINKKVEILDFLPEIGVDKVKSEIISGLHSTPKYISSSFFYDEAGSELFEAITELEEYYLSRAEKEIISNLVYRLDFDFNNLDIIELGSGDASKISLLFDQLPPGELETIDYYPVDISKSILEKSTSDINERFEINKITGIVADFKHQLPVLSGREKKLFCFFGSTIGNFDPEVRKDFMQALGEHLQPGDCFLLGADLIKNNSRIEAAYNDKMGITAAFNKNILSVVNSIIDSNFIEEDFEHVAFYNSVENRIEMHLEAQKEVNVLAGDNQEISIDQGERIHTENSYKFDFEKLEQIGDFAGLTIQNIFTDSAKLFSLVFYEK